MSFRHTLFVAVVSCDWRDRRVRRRADHQGQRLSQGRLHAGRDAVLPRRRAERQNVLICFGQNRDKISNRCRTVLASYGLQ